MSQTRIARVNPLNPEEGHIMRAVNILINGGLVIIPTETVYGIAANMMNKSALDRLYAVKQRPADKPFSLHIDNKMRVEEFVRSMSTSAYKLIDEFWPGPLTLILKSKDKGGVGLRMPNNQIALKIIGLAYVPVVCPSANISGRPAATNFQEAIKDFDGLVDMAIDAGETTLRVESSVVDLTVEPLKILREGPIKKEEIEAVAGKKIVLFICTGNSCRSVMARALLEKELRDKNRNDVEVISAGIMKGGGLQASEETRELLARENIDVSDHVSQRVTKIMIKKADLILVMEKTHEEVVREMAPEVRNRLFLLKEFAKINNGSLEIVDPISKPREFYEKVFNTIKEAVVKVGQLI